MTVRTRRWVWSAFVSIAFLSRTPSTYAQGAPAPITYQLTGGVQTYVVPANIGAVDIVAFGAQGANSRTWQNTWALGGAGARVSGRLWVNPGDKITIDVGGQGTVGIYNPGPGGHGGGGNGGTNACMAHSGGGGGGATWVYLNGVPVIVAGGGGGAGGWSGDTDSILGTGGSGGAPNGWAGAAGAGPGQFGYVDPGNGGTQTAGGTTLSVGADTAPGGSVFGGQPVLGTPGSAGQGGSGGATNGACGGAGGGGGGGFYGGGGGTGSTDYTVAGAGGGGGSSLVDPSIAEAEMDPNAHSGDGQVVLTPAPLDPRIATLQAEVDSLTFQNAALQKAVDTLRTQNATLTTENAALQKQVGALSTENAMLQSQVDNLTLQVNRLNGILAKAEAAMTTLADSLGGGLGKVPVVIVGSTLQEQIVALSAAIEALNHGQQQALYKNLGGQ